VLTRFQNTFPAQSQQGALADAKRTKRFSGRRRESHCSWNLGWHEPAQPTPRLNQLCGASPEGYSSLDVLTLSSITKGRQRMTRVINTKD